MLIAAYLVEAGLVLAFAPWTFLWDRNYFAHAWPWLGSLMASPYVRGGVTGVGIITIVAGGRDLMGMLFARRATPAVPPDAPRP